MDWEIALAMAAKVIADEAVSIGTTLADPLLSDADRQQALRALNELYARAGDLREMASQLPDRQRRRALRLRRLAPRKPRLCCT